MMQEHPPALVALRQTHRRHEFYDFEALLQHFLRLALRRPQL